MKRRSFRLEQELIDAVDAVRGRLRLNRTQYLRRALRCSVYGDASLFDTRKLSPTIRFLFKELAMETKHSKKRSEAGRARFSVGDQLKGVQAALKSNRTPSQLKPGLRKRAVQLEKLLEGNHG